MCLSRCLPFFHEPVKRERNYDRQGHRNQNLPWRLSLERPAVYLSAMRSADSVAGLGSLNFCQFPHSLSGEQHDATFKVPCIAEHSAATRRSSSGGNSPPATLPTCKVWSHSSDTPSKWTKALFAKSVTSVAGLSIPALCIATAADFRASSAPETLGM